MKIDEHTSRQNTALKRLLPNDASHYEATRRIDVAPIASNWTEIKPRPPEPERDEDYEQRLARRARFGVNDMDMFDRRVKRRPRK